jgi:uncharacterized repeat protein (TIGR03803 family)
VGVVFAVGSAASVASAAVLNTLVSFQVPAGVNPSGINPYGGLAFDHDGYLWGTTFGGGQFNRGAVFRITPGTNELYQASFPDDGTNGGLPYGSLTTDAAGDLYGTTYQGGANNYGTIFRMGAHTGTITTLASFGYSPAGPGAEPTFGRLVADAAGNLYGTATYAGANDKGTVFRMGASTNALTALASFDGANGDSPYGGLVFDAAGNLYGTTSKGGLDDVGTIFRIESGTNTLTTIVSFNTANGSSPYGDLNIDAAGNLYGTTTSGNYRGTVFRVDTATNTLTTLTSFTGDNGALPYAGLIMDAAGNLFGTTYAGGANDAGTVFRLDAGTNLLTTLISFDNANGAHPYTGLIADAAGNLYGTTPDGGAFGEGTVYEVTGAGFAVPEPSSLSLLIVAGTGLLCRRSRT